MMADVLGTGWAFPVRLDETAVRMAGGDDAVRQSIRTILETSPGERVMRPDFGCRIHDYVFAVNDAGTAGAITTAVLEALARWEPRIDVLAVDTDRDGDDPRRLLVRIGYRVRASNTVANLVYPFYLT